MELVVIRKAALPMKDTVLAGLPPEAWRGQDSEVTPWGPKLDVALTGLYNKCWLVLWFQCL